LQNTATAGGIASGNAGTLAAGGSVALGGGIAANVGFNVTAGGGITLVGRNSQVTLTSSQVPALSFNNLVIGTGSVVVNEGNTLTVVGRSGQVTLRSDQVRSVTVNGLTVPVTSLFGLGPLTLQRTTNLLMLLPAGQVVNRGRAQVTGSMSTIMQVNDLEKSGAAAGTLTPPRTSLTFE
jgi:hypothetical protein